MKARIMRRTGFTSTLLAIAIWTASAWVADGEPLAIRNCTWCHGGGAHGYPPAPQLAGQRRQYIESQLFGFQHRIRDNPDSRQYMWAAAEFLSPARVHFLAGYFSSLAAIPADNGHHEMVALGRRIYEEGVPTANVVACIACHGPSAEGAGSIPRLGGLSYFYLKQRLRQWAEGYNAAANAPMPRVATMLSAEQLDALASYLSFVK